MNYLMIFALQMDSVALSRLQIDIAYNKTGMMIRRFCHKIQGRINEYFKKL